MSEAQRWSGINLRVIKNEEEISGDRLMELHHALGQRAPKVIIMGGQEVPQSCL